MAEALEIIEVSGLDRKFCEEVMAQPGGENLLRCFACGTCVAGCPVNEIDPDYSPRKLVRQIVFGMKEEVLSSPRLWYCLVCYRCYARCPQKVNFTDIMRALRYLAIREGYCPPELIKLAEEIDQQSQQQRHKKVEEVFLSELEKFKQPKAQHG